MKQQLHQLRTLLGFNDSFIFEEKLLHGFSFLGAIIGLINFPMAVAGVYPKAAILTTIILFGTNSAVFICSRIFKKFNAAIIIFVLMASTLFIYEWRTMGGVRGTYGIAMLGFNIATMLLMPKKLIGKYILYIFSVAGAIFLIERYYPSVIIGPPVDFHTRQMQLFFMLIISTLSAYIFKKEEYHRKMQLLIKSRIQRHLVSAIEDKYIMASFDEEYQLIYLSNSAQSLLPFPDKKAMEQFLVTTAKSFMMQSSANRSKVLSLNEDGKDRFFDIHFHLEQEDRSQFTHLIIHDITQRKKDEITLQKALNHQAEINQMKTKFVSMVSHQFRTPLTTIQSACELLQMNQQSVNQPQKHHTQIFESVNSLKEMMERLLDFGRMENSNPILRREPCNIVEIIKDQIQKLTTSTYNGRSIQFQTKGQTQEVAVDYYLYQHICSNLMCNALKYSPSNSVIEVTLIFGASSCSLVVQDYGIGIPAEDQKKLFEPFYRASNTENHKGTGIGLSFVKQFVEIHDGQISLESELNLGTIMTVTIPYQTENELQSVHQQTKVST
ncbi:HAMP domain-containing sensor histidine kinase [Persicobacter psychrovividus]|uniref:histidine kinase n=1 Tax=Persicobacter psychrovividus TaxID=387638 RepID=A0ABN6L872_9BACT|nr:hypothetical protein PEPS_13140 [Persicobacter psychrovividus]